MRKTLLNTDKFNNIVIRNDLRKVEGYTLVDRDNTDIMRRVSVSQIYALYGNNEVSLPDELDDISNSVKQVMSCKLVKRIEHATGHNGASSVEYDIETESGETLRISRYEFMYLLGAGRIEGMGVVLKYGSEKYTGKVKYYDVPKEIVGDRAENKCCISFNDIHRDEDGLYVMDGKGNKIYMSNSVCAYVLGASSSIKNREALSLIKELGIDDYVVELIYEQQGNISYFPGHRDKSENTWILYDCNGDLLTVTNIETLQYLIGAGRISFKNCKSLVINSVEKIKKIHEPKVNVTCRCNEKGKLFVRIAGSKIDKEVPKSFIWYLCGFAESKYRHVSMEPIHYINHGGNRDCNYSLWNTYCLASKISIKLDKSRLHGNNDTVKLVAMDSDVAESIVEVKRKRVSEEGEYTTDFLDYTDKKDKVIVLLVNHEVVATDKWLIFMALGLFDIENVTYKTLPYFDKDRYLYGNVKIDLGEDGTLILE